MDFVRISTIQLPSSLTCDVKNAFKQVIDIWKERTYTVNRRLSSVVHVSEWDQRVDQILSASNTTRKDIEVRKFIPRSPEVFSTSAYETSFWLDDYAVDFYPYVLDEMRTPHVSFPYRFALEENSYHLWHLSLYVSDGSNDSNWLKHIAFPRLLRWFSDVNEKNHFTISHNLINTEDYAHLYQELKNKWGRQIDWTERTDPKKFVYEDCAIAAYLIAYWRKNGFFIRKFCDIGCGNGLLVYLLQEMNLNGYGIDLRQRAIWTKFTGADLREQVLNPETTLLTDVDFLIGNHTDELTPWIPIMAARSASNFFLLPCCPFDFYGRFQKKSGMNAGSSYSSYIPFIRRICLSLGYNVEEDRLKIPSTKRYCFLCTVPADGLVDNLEEVISSILAPANLTNFIPREKIEKVKNCSQLPWKFRQTLTLQIFEHLFRHSPGGEVRSCSGWRQGGSCSLNEIANSLSVDVKAHLRNSHGGLQTFLKNQHQVCKGIVSIRDWSKEGRRKLEGKVKTSECWFYSNHPDGCPLSDEDCSYKH